MATAPGTILIIEVSWDPHYSKRVAGSVKKGGSAMLEVTFA
jgi:hypothetical protein